MKMMDLHLGNPGVQEQLAIECAFLKAFAA